MNTNISMRLSRLTEQFKKTGFVSEARLLHMHAKDSLVDIVFVTQATPSQTMFTLETRLAGHQDTWVIRCESLNPDNLGKELTEETIELLQKGNDWILHLYLKRPHRPFVLMADEYVTYVKKQTDQGKLATLHRKSGHFSTSIRFPIELHDLLRRETASISSTVVDIVAKEYKKRGYYD